MATTIIKSQVESAIARLRDLPTRESDRLSRRAAVAEMRQEIQAALGRGYTLEEVAKLLSQTDPGFSGLALSTLRTYLRADRDRAAVATARKNTKKPRPTPSRTPPAPSVNSATEPRQKPMGIPARTNAGLREDI